MFHHWIVASVPPLKHCSPLELIASDRTGPLSQEKREKLVRKPTKKLTFAPLPPLSKFMWYLKLFKLTCTFERY